MKFATLLCSLLFVSSCLADGEGSLPDLLLGTNVASAFAADAAASIQGGSVEHLACILDRLHQPYQIAHMPWRRAHQEVRKQHLDGFFTAILVGDGDEHGRLSAPLVLENWYWFLRADMPEPASWREQKVGAIIGSPQAIWLAHRGYPEPVAASNLPQLVKMLLSARIDAVLAGKEHFERVAMELGVASGAYQFRFYRYMPLGVYFSRPALARRGDFLERFNREIFPCAPEAFRISAFERDLIKTAVMPLLQDWRQHDALVAGVIIQNEHLESTPLSELQQRDASWQQLFYRGYSREAQRMLESGLSRQLREWKRASDGLVSEIIVMDARGFNVAISDMTSDYWQGDEEKYLELMGSPADELHIGPVIYDESTRRFQVQMSVQVFRPGAARAIGILTLGVDIEKALALAQ